MTVEVANPIALFTVAGIGPYAIPWAYLSDTLAVAVAEDGIFDPLGPSDFTITPASGASGNAFLSVDAAATHAGKTLALTRATPSQQGWAATLGEREAGLERQLDTLTMAQQELRRDLAATLRVAGADQPLLEMPDDTVPVWDGTRFIPGPLVGDIAAATDAAERAEAAAADAEEDRQHIGDLLASIDPNPDAYGRPVRIRHVGDGVTTSFAMPPNALSIGNLLSVTIDGVVQHGNSYSVDAGLLTPSTVLRDDVVMEITAWTALNAEDSNTRRAYAFSGRAAFIAALGWPWEVGAVVSDRRVQYKYLGTGTAIADAPGWVPFGRVAFDHWEPNTTPGTTNMRGAIIAAYAYLNSIGGGVIDGQFATYAVSAMVDLTNHYNVKTINCAFVATGAWAADTPIFKVVAGTSQITKMAWEYCTVEGAGEANGWLVDDAGTVSIVHCNAHGIPNYAVRSRTKATELRIQNCDFRQFVFGEAGFDVEANRTAILIDIETADHFIYNNTCAYAYEGLRVAVRGPGQIKGNHLYNGAQTSATFQTRVATIAAPNIVLIGNYFDNGIVRIDASIVDSTPMILLSGNHFHKNADGTNTELLEFFGGVSADLRGVVMVANTFSVGAPGVIFTGTFVADEWMRWTLLGNIQGDGSGVPGLPDAVIHGNVLYGQNTILGTVSESSGTPKGALIETGSNANGSYVRLADGTQKCWHTLTASAGAAVTWTFPIAFDAAPTVAGNAIASVLAAVQMDAAPNTTAVTLSVRDKTDARRADVMHLTATGRWF